MAFWRAGCAIAGLLFLGSIEAVAAPSFDCKKAAKADEIAICADAMLSKNDRATTEAFREAKKKNPTAALAKARSFLATRSACGASLDCIADAQLQAVLDFQMIGPTTQETVQPPVEEAAPVADVSGGIKQNCEREWPDDFRMQEFCINRQMEALNAVGPIAKSGSKIEQRIVGKCATEWKNPEGYDYRMVKLCFDRQIESYRRLN